MDKYEYKVRADEIKALIAEGEYAEAVKIADTIDWRRVKSVMMLCTISDLYKINRRYEDSRDILLLAYERHSGGRLIVYSLCELSIKLEEYVQAIEYYKEFVQLAPKDSGRYVLQYKLYEAQEVSLEERIAVLEELKKKDYREKWAYELAYLYHRVGLASKCIEECDEMYLWFGEGRYVLKALELKQLHTPLSDEQQIKYELMKQTGGIIVSDLERQQQSIQEEAGQETEEEEDDEFSLKENLLTDPTQELPGKGLDDIQVKTVDVSRYNTINLQKELAESMKEFLESHPTADIPVQQIAEAEAGGGVYEPVREAGNAEGHVTGETKVYEPIEGLPRAEGLEMAENPAAPVEEAQMASSIMNRDAEGAHKPVSEEVFFGNTAEVNIQDVVSQLVEQNAEVKPFVARDAKAVKEQLQGAVRQSQPVYEAQESGSAQERPSPAYEANGFRSGSQKKAAVPVASPNPSVSNTGVIKTFHAPSGYDEILSQEYDGQLSIVVPEEEKVEKQITGQLSIEDIMAEWERVKKENENRRMEEIKKRVHQQTDILFADFDESTKTGLLEELEKAMVSAAMKEEKKRAELERPKVVKVADMEQKAAAQTASASKAAVQTAAAAPASITAVPAAKMVQAQKTADQVEAAAQNTIKTPEAAEKPSLQAAEKLVSSEEIPQQVEAALYEPAGSLQEAEAQAVQEPVTEAGEGEESLFAQEETVEITESEEAPDEESGGAEEETEPASDGKVVDFETAGSKYQAREMSQSEKEQFAPFIHHRKTRRQIVEAIDNISMAPYTGNVIITGEEGTGTTALAKLLVKEIQLSDSNFSGKVAKISGTTMNKKDVGATLAKLEGGALIIEGAGAMKKSTAESLMKELNQENGGLIVLLEDGKAQMNEFLDKYEGLKTIFNLRVDVEALDDQTLVKYAKKYALDQEYSIDELGVLALHTRIADMQTSDHEVTLAEIEELVDEAIYYADKKTPAHFIDILMGKRYDEEDMIVLREKDFMHY